MVRDEKVTRLLDQLIGSFVGNLEDYGEARTNQRRRQVTNILKRHHGTSDDFIVRQRLDGLDERWRILNNPELADSVCQRTRCFSKTSYKWKPEVLTFLLELQDDPVRKTTLEDLSQFEEQESPPPLTWSELIQDDSVRDPAGLWETIDYDEESSSQDDHSEPEASYIHDAKSSRSKDHQTEPTKYDIESSLDSPDYGLLSEIEDGLTRKDAIPAEISLSEHEVMRETLWMLHGRQTRLFSIDADDNIVLNRQIRIFGVDHSVISIVLENFVGKGNELKRLREWTVFEVQSPMIQTLQSALSHELQHVQESLSVLEYIKAKPSPTVLTLISLQPRVDCITRRLVALSRILPSFQDMPAESQYLDVLDSLHIKSSQCSLTGDSEMFSSTSRLLFESLLTYLKPAQVWMENGEVEVDDWPFFVRRRSEDMSLESVWSDQFYLVKDDGGKLQAPRLLWPVSRKLFVAGKNVHLLRLLGQHPPKRPERSLRAVFEEILQQGVNENSATFSDLFMSSLSKWAEERYQASSCLLREVLASRYGLWRTLDALDYVYLARDGSLTSQLALYIAALTMKAMPVIVGKARQVFSDVKDVDGKALSVSFDKYQNTPRRKHSPMQRMESLIIHYRLPWNIGLIINKESLTIYQRIAILLLQLTYFRQILNRHHSDKFEKKDSMANSQYRMMLRLRHNLTWFLNNLCTYLAAMMLPEASAAMRSKMEKATDLDEMISAHADYIRTISFRCFLTESQAPVLQAIKSILEICQIFSSSLHSSADDLKPLSQYQDKDVSDSSAAFVEESTAAEIAGTGEFQSGQMIRTEKQRHLMKTYRDLLEFVTAKAKEASRLEADPILELFAENLEMGIRKILERPSKY